LKLHSLPSSDYPRGDQRKRRGVAFKTFWVAVQGDGGGGRAGKEGGEKREKNAKFREINNKGGKERREMNAL